MILFNQTDATGQKCLGPILINPSCISAIFPMGELNGNGATIYTNEFNANRYFVKEKFNQILVSLNVMSAED